MTAAALLVVLGAALLMQVSGLTMAMGAFLAGVLLSESTFRHQIEADIEPFRGILLGLFFRGWYVIDSSFSKLLRKSNEKLSHLKLLIALYLWLKVENLPLYYSRLRAKRTSH